MNRYEFLKLKAGLLCEGAVLSETARKSMEIERPKFFNKGFIDAVNMNILGSNICVSIAENFSTNIQDKPYLSVLLAKVPAISDAPQSDLEIGNWLCAAFDSLKNAKHQQTLKAASTWNKVGSKISSGFSLFK
jgi:hypothetical protein